MEFYQTSYNHYIYNIHYFFYKKIVVVFFCDHKIYLQSHPLRHTHVPEEKNIMQDYGSLNAAVNSQTYGHFPTISYSH